MDQTAADDLQRTVEDEVKNRLPGVVQRVALLRYGDSPAIGPAELLISAGVAAVARRASAGHWTASANGQHSRSYASAAVRSTGSNRVLTRLRPARCRS